MENLYKERLYCLMASEFELIPEARGNHLLTGEACRVDFLCYPRTEAIDKGFERVWFAIECKAPESDESVKKCLDGLAQALSYRDSDFEGRRPEMVFLFPELLRFVDYDNHHKYAGQLFNQTTAAHTILLRRFLERLSIGEIIECPKRGFEMRFKSNRYYDPERGRSGIPNLGRATRVGSRKRKPSKEHHSTGSPDLSRLFSDDQNP